MGDLLCKNRLVDMSYSINHLFETIHNLYENIGLHIVQYLQVPFFTKIEHELHFQLCTLN